MDERESAEWRIVLSDKIGSIHLTSCEVSPVRALQEAVKKTPGRIWDRYEVLTVRPIHVTSHGGCDESIQH